MNEKVISKYIYDVVLKLNIGISFTLNNRIKLNKL